MTEATRARAQRLLIEVLLLETHERPAFIENACGSDAKLRGDLLKLIADSEGAYDHFEEVSERLAWASRLDADPSATPSSIANYRIIRRIGQGGMGTVYPCRTARRRV